VRFNEFFVENLWRWKCGLPERDILDKNQMGSMKLETLYNTEWSEEFEQLMRNRLLMGAFRYGKFNEPGKPQYDRIGSTISRLQKYKQTGNKEYLVDSANLCLMEFVECNHPKEHFSSIDDGEHTKTVRAINQNS